MVLLFAYFLLAIGVSFLCSILEAVLLSITPSFVSAAADEGNRWGKILKNLKEDVERPLAAILSLNTIAHTVGAAGVGAQAQIVFQHIPLSVVSAILTLLILILSEIIPKTLGAHYWRQLAPVSTMLTHYLTIFLMPLVILSRFISRFLSGGDQAGSITRGEISAIAEMGQREGILDQSDAQALRSVLDFQGQHVRDVFTPRVVVRHIDPKQTIGELFSSDPDLPFSRYPLLDTNEKIEGYVLKNDLLAAAAKGERDLTTAGLSREVLIVPDTAPLKTLFGKFLRRKEHLAVVVDEFGSFAGIISLEDILETLIGHEIMDEADEVEDMRDFARKSTPPPPRPNP